MTIAGALTCARGTVVGGARGDARAALIAD